MFTGIIDHCGQIINRANHSGNVSLTLQTTFSDINVGESIAIDGICLTVTTKEADSFTVDVSPETLKLTIASRYKEGDNVNLERALRLSDRLGGHFVTGHVDGQCEVTQRVAYGEYVELELRHNIAGAERFLVSKGSIALNGVSLTLNEVGLKCFKVMLIPHTLQETTLNTLKTGDLVNVEFDYLAKLVNNQLNVKNDEKYAISHD